MSDFRKSDTVMALGYVIGTEGDLIIVSINGQEVKVRAEDASIIKRSYHAGDPVWCRETKAFIKDTVETGVHLVHFPSELGADAYAVVDESVLAHRDLEEEQEPEHTRVVAVQQAPELPAPEAASREAERDASVTEAAPSGMTASEESEAHVSSAAADGAEQGSAATIPANPAPAVTEPSAAPAADAPDVANERNIHSLADAFASSLHGEGGNGSDEGRVDIPLERLGVTTEYAPLNERHHQVA